MVTINIIVMTDVGLYYNRIKQMWRTKKGFSTPKDSERE